VLAAGKSNAAEMFATESRRTRRKRRGFLDRIDRIEGMDGDGVFNAVDGRAVGDSSLRSE